MDVVLYLRKLHTNLYEVLGKQKTSGESNEKLVWLRKIG